LRGNQHPAALKGESMIVVKDIHKSFGTLEVLKGVDLTVEKGEIVSIIGKSGAGKTTLLQIIGTLDNPDSGNVVIDGVDVFALKEKELADYRNRHIGFIFQFHQLLPEFTTLENVMMPAMIARVGEKEAEKRAVKLLTELGMAERLTHKPSQLSGGEKQRVAAARAMMMSPDVILADEPSGSLDESNKKELHKLLLQMREQYGQTIIIVTHDKELAEISDRVIEMKDGVCANGAV
jgi:lipoprotein-releasing system ATP-binding protein